MAHAWESDASDAENDPLPRARADKRMRHVWEDESDLQDLAENSDVGSEENSDSDFEINAENEFLAEMCELLGKRTIVANQFTHRFATKTSQNDQFLGTDANQCRLMQIDANQIQAK